MYSPMANSAWGGTSAMNIVLQTERLRLRPLGELDADAMERFCTDPEVRRYLFEDRILERDAIVDIIGRSVSSFAAEGFGYFGLELRDDSGQPSSGLIGFCGHRRFEDGEQVELLYGILPEHWGEGLVSEAATEALRDVFDRCQVERVIAATDTPNQRSVRVLQRLGMTFDTRREFHDLDTVFYSMTRDDVNLPVDT
jgi:ribosomal-protein-alanine N-acetyltransferase